MKTTILIALLAIVAMACEKSTELRHPRAEYGQIAILTNEGEFVKAVNMLPYDTLQVGDFKVVYKKRVNDFK